MDQKKAPEQFKDSDYTTVLTMTFEDKGRADAAAATFNAACKSGEMRARVRVSEVLPTPGTTVPPMPL